MKYGNKQRRRARRRMASSANVGLDKETTLELEENKAFHMGRALQSTPCRRNSRKPKPSWATACPGRGPKPRDTQAFNGMESKHAPQHVCKNDGWTDPLIF